jgi:hypothetical protein
MRSLSLTPRQDLDWDGDLWLVPILVCGSRRIGDAFERRGSGALRRTGASSATEPIPLRGAPLTRTLGPETIASF